MPDDRKRFDQQQGSDQQQYAKQSEQQSPLDDLEAGADDVEKVKGGLRHRGDPCDGGE